MEKKYKIMMMSLARIVEPLNVTLSVSDKNLDTARTMLAAAFNYVIFNSTS